MRSLSPPRAGSTAPFPSCHSIPVQRLATKIGPTIVAPRKAPQPPAPGSKRGAPICPSPHPLFLVRVCGEAVA